MKTGVVGVGTDTAMLGADALGAGVIAVCVSIGVPRSLRPSLATQSKPHIEKLTRDAQSAPEVACRPVVWVVSTPLGVLAFTPILQFSASNASVEFPIVTVASGLQTHPCEGPLSKMQHSTFDEDVTPIGPAHSAADVTGAPCSVTLCVTLPPLSNVADVCMNVTVHVVAEYVTVALRSTGDVAVESAPHMHVGGPASPLNAQHVSLVDESPDDDDAPEDEQATKTKIEAASVAFGRVIRLKRTTGVGALASLERAGVVVPLVRSLASLERADVVVSLVRSLASLERAGVVVPLVRSLASLERAD